jgi:PAS domain S-box-containing protein
MDISNTTEQIRERLEIAQHAVRLGIYDIDIKNGVVYWDKRTRELWGITQDDPLTYDNFINRVVPEDRQYVQSQVNNALEPDGNGFIEIEYRIVNSTTKEFIWIHATGNVFFKYGDAVRLIGTVQDITERKRIQEEMHQHMRELTTANKELESFSFSVSHDLRSPLNAINCLNEILLEEYSDRLDKDGKDILKRIKTSIRKMASTIDDILRFTEISRETMNREVINLSSIAHSVVHELCQSAPERSVAVSIIDGLVAIADARLITIALTNLIGNAWKYTSFNPDARIEIGETFTKNEHVFFIRDNGIGFDMTLVNRLFKPFQRLHSSNQFPGTGIGLAIVHKIIQRHGGRIWVESDAGRGTTFYFTIENTRVTERTFQNDSPGILIIDDDSNDVYFTKRALRKLLPDCNLEVVSDGDQAIELLSSCDSFQLILLDLKLPGIGGIEILRFIKSQEHLKHIPVIILSSSALTGDIDLSYNAGAASFVNKSFDFNDFSASLKIIIDNWLNKKHSEAEKEEKLENA